MMRDGTATKELIGRTALRLFIEKGITETTIRDITSCAGIAVGTLYRHYGSKEELAWELFAESYMTIGRELHGIRIKEATARSKLEAMIRHFCNIFDKDTAMFTYLFLARHRHLQKLTPRMPNPYIEFRSVINEGIRRGEIPRQDPDVSASMVMGLIMQMIDSRLLGQRIKQSIASLADTTVAASLRVVEA